VTASTVAEPVRSKPKIPQEFSCRPEPGVRGTLGVAQPTRKRQKETPVKHQQEYVGIDQHRRRNVIVRRNQAVRPSRRSGSRMTR